MLYDLSNPLQAEQFKSRSALLVKNGKIVELTEKKPKRRLNQNSYLWLLIGYWATQTGYTNDEAESIYKEINKDIYFVDKEIAGEKVRYIRHTYELDTREMSLSIERWRNWSVMNEAFSVYLPAPNEERLIQLMEIEVGRNKEFV